ncbi:hypothetical protein Pa4123_51720 [Phytohabitans aurantiacus]|uniref:Transcriptional regulator n=2 Tax=Phytohabitans aurantiacus TaxID=3016789 RepID=A0ABQ5QZB4_9ACTN|nr:hypothetical protein Pa4123_51720 [Phytohabitans aurantiacus]
MNGGKVPERNQELAAQITDAGMTIPEVADAISERVQDLTGKEFDYTERSVRRLLCGATSWPHAPVRLALESLFETSAVDLGFTPRSGSSRTPSGGVTSAFDRPFLHEQEGSVRRRDLFDIAGGALFSIIVPSLPRRGRIGQSDLVRLRDPLTQLFTADDAAGGVALAQEAVWHADRLLEARKRYEMSVAVSDALHGLAGQYKAAAGWFAIDADDLTLAGQVLPEALKLAALAGDNLLTVQVWNYMAMRARQAGEGGEIHQISRTALRSTAARQHPRAAALFHCRAAYGRAWRGERRQALRSLQRAHDVLGNACDEDVPTWLGFVNRAQLFAQETLVHSLLGQWNEAVESAQSDLRLIPGAYHRNRVHGLIHLAKANLGARSPEIAADAATSAVHEISSLSGSLRAGRAAARLRKLRGRMETWRPVPEVARWLDFYDTSLSAA